MPLTKTQVYWVWLSGYGVTFADAKTFCRWQKKRLPTRFEWAFAVRGENVEDLFLGPFIFSRTNKGANFGDAKNGKPVVDESDGVIYVARTRLFKASANRSGVLNLSGT